MPINAPNGFTPVRHLSGATLRSNEYQIASGSATSIFTGDLVKLLTTGFIDVAAATDTNIIGVFGGVSWTDTDGTPRFEKRWPGGTATLGSRAARAVVYDDPNIVFEAQCTTGTACVQADIGGNADILATAGNVATGISRHTIAISGVGASSAQIRILGLGAGSDFGDATRYECLINEHLLRVTAGI